MLAALSIIFTDLASDSPVLAPAEQERVADALEDDAEVMSNTRLEELLAGQPEDVKAEIIEINTDARPRALQVALLVPLLAGLIGLSTRSGWCDCRTGGHRNRRRRPRLLETPRGRSRAWPATALSCIALDYER